MNETDELEEPRASLLPGLTQRMPELGRIRMGEKTERGAPLRLKTFRLTSASKATLEAAAQLYGGQVRPWPDAPDDGMFQLTTGAAELDILIPSSFAVIGQTFEYWQGGTCERRCDGVTESISGSSCLCTAEGLVGPDRLCDVITRLRVILPRVPGLGVWRLDTSGYVAATTLPTTVQMLARLTPGAWIPAVLRAEQRSKKERLENKKVETHRFVVPVIDLPGVTIAGALGHGAAPAPQLEAGEERPKPPTAAERAAARRAELERTNEAGGSAGTTQTEPSVPAPSAPASQCRVRSPAGAVCELGDGHDGDHRRGNVRWPTPKQAANPVAATERRPTGDSEAGQGATAGEVTTSAVDAVAITREVFEGDFVDEPTAELQAGLDLIGK